MIISPLMMIDINIETKVNDDNNDMSALNKKKPFKMIDNVFGQISTNKRYSDWFHVDHEKKKQINKKLKANTNFKLNNIITRERKPLLIGTNVNSNIKGIEKRLHFYTSRWNVKTTVSDVKSYVASILNDHAIDVEEITLKQGNMKSFKVITAKQHHNAMYNIENWPENIQIKRFWYNKANRVAKNNENLSTQNDEENKDNMEADAAAKDAIVGTNKNRNNINSENNNKNSFVQ